MGRVLLCKWEAYCHTSEGSNLGFPFLRAHRERKHRNTSGRGHGPSFDRCEGLVAHKRVQKLLAMELEFSIDSAKLDVLQKGVVYKLHAGWFINRTPGEFKNCGLFIKFKGSCRGNPTEKWESLKLNFWPAGSLSVQPGHRDCLPQVRGFRTGKNTTHQVFALSILEQQMWNLCL